MDANLGKSQPYAGMLYLVEREEKNRANCMWEKSFPKTSRLTDQTSRRASEFGIQSSQGGTGPAIAYRRVGGRVQPKGLKS
jgi:hypothetical protein